MIRTMMAAAALLVAAAPAAAQEARPVSGTRLDVVANGEVTKVPDTVRINAGVATQAATATEAIRQNARQMDSMRAALRRADVAERDIQTTAISLQPEWRYAENSAPVFLGYRAHNSVSVRFRDIADAGAILDALVAAGANQIDGPTLYIERPEPALDEARAQAVANARARAELYARALGMRVTRILSVSEAGMVHVPRPEQMMARDVAAVSGTQIVPGEQTLTVSLTVSFELQ